MRQTKVSELEAARALKAAGGNVRIAAAALGVARSTLYLMLQNAPGLAAVRQQARQRTIEDAVALLRAAEAARKARRDRELLPARRRAAAHARAVRAARRQNQGR